MNASLRLYGASWYPGTNSVGVRGDRAIDVQSSGRALGVDIILNKSTGIRGKSTLAAKIHYCTLFDSQYATRALVMMDSLVEHARDPFDLTILAMDDAVATLIEKVGRPEWRVVRVSDLADAEFTAIERTRPRREFCWTAAPVLCKRLIDTASEGDLVIYVDADLMFFDNPRILLDELGEDGTILIHEHRYSPDREAWAATSGRFNVGFVAFQVGDEARRCADRWRNQVIEKCELDPDNGYCGDQGYLNEWPDLYPGLRIMRNIGGGTAPWNLDAYQPDGTARHPKVNGTSLVFFHYHAFRTVALKQFGLVAARPAYGYNFPRTSNHLFFKRYARRIRSASRKAGRAAFHVAADETVALREMLRGIAAGHYVLALPI